MFSTLLTRRNVIHQLSAGTGLLLVSGCSQPASNGRRIAIANAAGGLNMTMSALMRDQRFLEKAGLKPEVAMIADGTRIVGGIIGGSVDASFMSGFGQILPAIERGAELRVIGGGITLPTLALYSSKPDIRSLIDLEGRTVGTGSIGALTYQLTVTLLRKYRVSIDKIRFVNVGSSADIFRAVSAGTIDAGVGQAAQIGNAEEYNVHLIDKGNMAEELGVYTYQGAWTTVQAIAQHRDLLVRALAAYGRLYRFVQRPEAKEAFMTARKSAFPKARPADHEAEWSFIQQYRPFASSLALSAERIDYMQRLNVAFEVQKEIMPIARVADMSLALEAEKLIGS